MASIAANGGITIAQDKDSCVVYGMPKQAVELGVVNHVLALDQIAPMLNILAHHHDSIGSNHGRSAQHGN
jgi:two-component system, chemotaxis family, protein-glutamate methylesterase/glutaminase